MKCVRCSAEKLAQTDKYCYGLERTSSGVKLREGAGWVCEACGYRFRDKLALSPFEKELIDIWRSSRGLPVLYETDTSFLPAVSGQRSKWVRGG